MAMTWLLRMLFYGMAILWGVFAAGCVKIPAPLENVDDFYRRFSERKASQVIPSEKELTLKRAVEIALLNNPTNLAAARAVVAARYGYFRALAAYAPEINATYSLGHTLSRGWDLKNPPDIWQIVLSCLRQHR